VVTTSTTSIAFKWPSALTAQLVVSIRHYRESAAAGSGCRPCTFGGKQAQTDMVKELLKGEPPCTARAIRKGSIS